MSLRRVRVSVVVCVTLAAWGMAACGNAAPDKQRSSASPSSVPARHKAHTGFEFITYDSPALAKLMSGARALPHRGCQTTTIGGLNVGSSVEVDVFGPARTSCGAADAQLRQVPLALRAGVRGAVSGWECVWTDHEAIGCRKGPEVSTASNPGE